MRINTGVQPRKNFRDKKYIMKIALSCISRRERHYDPRVDARNARKIASNANTLVTGRVPTIKSEKHLLRLLLAGVEHHKPTTAQIFKPSKQIYLMVE